MKTNISLKKITALLFSAFLVISALPGVSSAESAKSAIAEKARIAGIGVPAAATKSSSVPNRAAPQQEREWLVMVYMSAKNDLGIANLAFDSVNDMEKIGSTDRVAAVVEYGSFEKKNGLASINSNSRTIAIRKDDKTDSITSPVIYTTEEADMANPDTLVNFVHRAVKKFPAKKYMLLVWNHGGGLNGISSDVMYNSIMSVKDLGNALREIKEITKKKLDIFAMDACLMQVASVAYQFRDSAEIIIGSQLTEPGEGFPYGWLLNHLNNEYEGDDVETAAKIVWAYSEYNRNVPDLSLSALNTSAMPGFVSRLDGWVNAVKADHKALKYAASISTVKDSASTNQNDYHDLISYFEIVKSKIDDSPAKKATEDIISYMKKDLIIYNYSRFGDTYGLSVFIPHKDYVKSEYWDLDFASASAWPEFLVESAKKW